jgi:hypothetical protein
VPKWVRSTAWCGAALVFLFLYVFVIPPAVIALEERDALPGGKAYQFLEIVLSPLKWLYEHVEVYEAYLEWLSDVLA